MRSNREEAFKGPLFIIGAGRSGTSFLLKMVNCLPNTRLVFESDVISTAEKLFSNEIVDSRERFAQFLRRLKKVDYPASISVDSDVSPATPLFVQQPEFYDQLYAEFRQHRSLPRFIASLYRAGAREDSVWGDKTADLSQIPSILRLFPEARFIAIIRDPRSVVCSMKEHSGISLLTGSYLWSGIASAISRLFEDLGERRVHLIYYEELVSSAQATLDEIAAFIGIQPPTDLTIVQSAHTQSLEKWRSCLRTRDLELVEGICFEQMCKFRYKPEVASRGTRVGPIRFVGSMLLHAIGLLRHKRSTLLRIFNARAVMKYARLYFQK